MVFPPCEARARSKALLVGLGEAVRPDVARADAMMRGYINLSGLNELPSTLYTGALIVGVVEVGIWGWAAGSAAYGPFMTWAGTSQGQTILNEFFPSMFPGPYFPNWWGVGGMQAGRALGIE